MPEAPSPYWLTPCSFPSQLLLQFILSILCILSTTQLQLSL